MKMGQSPRVIPPIVPSQLDKVKDYREEVQAALEVIKGIDTSVEEAKQTVTSHLFERKEEA
jgi:hypothetical protein